MVELIFFTIFAYNSLNLSDEYMDITVVIPYRNRQDFLGATLQSFLAQPYRPLRLVLVDDGSTDGSADLCARFAARYSSDNFCVTLLSSTERGAAAARNVGLAVVDTPWVYFFDSDDILSPDFFSAFHQYCDSQIQPDIIAFPIRMVWTNGHTKSRSALYTASVSAQILSAHLSTHGMVLRTDFLRSSGGWDKSVLKWDDWELAARLLLYGARVVWLRGRAWHSINQHPDSITGAGFSPGYDNLNYAIHTVAHNIRTITPAIATSDSAPLQCNTDTTRRSLLALALRSAILAGHLHREGDYVHVEEQTEQARILCDEAQGGILARKIISFCTYYTAYGGRGAWHFALALLPLL